MNWYKQAKDFETPITDEATAKLQTQPLITTEEEETQLGIIKEFGTKNQYLANNPFYSKINKTFGTPEWGILVKKSNIWEMQQVLKDKPVYWNQNSKLAPSSEEMKIFAKNYNLFYKHTKRGDFIAKTKIAMDRMQKALFEDNPREIGLALGYEDLFH